MPTLEVDVIAKLDSLEKELKTIPGIGEKEAKKLARGMTKELATIARSSKAMASEIKAANAGAFKDIEKAGDKMTGGLLGDLDDLAQGAKGLVTALGPVAGVAGIAGVAFAAAGAAGVGLAASLAYGSVSVVRAADEAIERLDALSLTGAVDARTVEDVRTANAALDALGVSSDLLTATLGGVLAPVVQETAEAIAKMGLFVVDNVETIGTMIGAVDRLIGVLSGGRDGFGSLAKSVQGLNVLLGAYDGQIDQVTQRLEAQAAAQETVAMVQQKVGDRTKELEAQEKKRVEAMNIATKAQAERDKAVAQGIQIQSKARDLAISMGAVELTAAGQVEAAYRQRLATIAELQTQGLSRAETAVLLDQAEAERIFKINALETAEAQKLAAQKVAFSQYVYAETEKNRAASQAAESRAAEDSKRLAAEVATERIRQEEGVRDAAFAIAQSLTDGIVGLFDLQLKAAEERNGKESASYRKAAMAQYIATKATGLADVFIKTAQSVMTGFALFGPPPSPAGIGAAVAAGIAGAAQATIIAAAPPPTFHGGTSMVPGMQGGTGGMAADEMPANLQAGESVLTGRATRQIGRDGVDALNRGQDIGGDTVVHVYIGGQKAQPDRVVTQRGRRGKTTGQRPYERG